jgi:hypothetical protein
MEAVGLTPEQAKICMKNIKKTFKEWGGKGGQRVTKKVVKDEQELGKLGMNLYQCRCSVLSGYLYLEAVFARVAKHTSPRFRDICTRRKYTRNRILAPIWSQIQTVNLAIN